MPTRPMLCPFALIEGRHVALPVAAVIHNRFSHAWDLIISRNSTAKR